MHGDALADSAATESKNALDQRASAFACDDDAFDVAAQPSAGTDVTKRHFPVTEDCAEKIVEVVRDAAGKRAERFQTLSLTQLSLHPPELFRAHVVIGDIEHESDNACGLALRIEEQATLRVEPPDRAA